jgi:hypothetical protein
MTRTLGRTGVDVTILSYGAMELRGQPRGPEIADEDAGRPVKGSDRAEGPGLVILAQLGDCLAGRLVGGQVDDQLLLVAGG